MAFAHATIGLGKLLLGHAEETNAHISEALRLSPRDTWAGHWMTMAGDAKAHLRQFDHAVAWYRRAIEANRNNLSAHFGLGLALALLGRVDEARSAIKAVLALYPEFTISRARAGLMAMSDDPKYLAGIEGGLEGLCLAGVPE